MSSLQPNVLFLFPDQWRWDWLGCERSPYGEVPVRTPNIDALARRGVRFTGCRSPSPLCVPARAALARGVRYHRCGTVDNAGPVHLDRPTIFRNCRDQGYRVLTCGKSDLHGHFEGYHNSGWHPAMGQLGFSDSIDQRGKINSARPRPDNPGPYVSYLRSLGLLEAHIRDYRQRGEGFGTLELSPHPTPLPREHFTDDFCGRSALDLLQRTPAGAPWLLWVNFPGPHDPHDAPRELQQLYDGVSFPEPTPGPGGPDPRPIQHQQLRRNYAASCTGIDQWVGRIIDAVAQRGELDRTLIIFASDHGEMLGDHNRWLKSVPHDPSIRVPLVVAGPHVQQDVVCDDPVELIDLAATIADWTQSDPLPGWDSRSLRPVLTGSSADHRPYAMSQLANWRCASEKQWKLIEHRDGARHLFDLVDDPCEQHEISERRPAEVARLAALLERENPWQPTPES